MTTTLDAAYFRAMRKPAKQEEEAGPYPEPEHTSRDPWPEDFLEPGPVVKLRKLAESHGWAVRVTYARGYPPHKATGKPGALVHTVAVQCFHPESSARLVAMYAIPAGSPAGKKWDGVLIASSSIPPYAGCSITDAAEYVKASGRVLPSWLEAVKWRNTLRTLTDKVWRDYCAGATLAAMADAYEVDKAVVMKIIQDCRAAGKVKPGKAKSKKESGG